MFNFQNLIFKSFVGFGHKSEAEEKVVENPYCKMWRMDHEDIIF